MMRADRKFPTSKLLFLLAFVLRIECQECFEDNSVEDLEADVASALKNLQNTYNSLHVRDNLVGRVQLCVQQYGRRFERLLR